MKRLATAASALLLVGTLAACENAPLAPVGDDLSATPSMAAANPRAACWGQATKVFAQLGEMGQHASEQPTPRAGLRNLARLLADAGIIPDDSMASLGEFVANALGLSIEACM